MKTVIFACVHNAGRSQMSAAFFNQIVNPQKARAISAGTQPGDRVHPEVVEVMKEVGLDLSSEKPKQLSESLASCANLLITMGCGDACPYVPGLEIRDWQLVDPKGLERERVREIRDQIRDRVAELADEHGWR